MADIHKLSEQVIDYAERVANVADAAQGKNRNGAGARWLLLPAAGAGLYALVKSDFFTRGAKVVADEAKTRAAELPDDLIKAVRQTSPSQKSSNGSTSASRSTSSGRSRRRTTSRRTTSSSRSSR